jgi:hypothetical protein
MPEKQSSVEHLQSMPFAFRFSLFLACCWLIAYYRVRKIVRSSQSAHTKNDADHHRLRIRDCSTTSNTTSSQNVCSHPNHDAHRTYWYQSHCTRTELATIQIMKVVGYIARRRCCGKNLAFADIQLLEEDTTCTNSEVVGVATTKNHHEHNHQNNNQDHHSPSGRVIQVTFRRNSPAWNKDLDETFPTKNAKLPYGGKVAVELEVVSSNDDGRGIPPNKHDMERNSSDDSTVVVNDAKPCNFLVRQWTLLEHPHEKALAEAQAPESGGDGISCTVYLKSRTDAFLRFNDTTLRRHPKAKQSSNHKNQQDETTLLPPAAVTATSSNNNSKDASEFSHGDNRAKALRATIFASWLIETFGKEYLQSSNTTTGAGAGGVLDIAGGKGKLSIELAIQGHIPCTIVDPLVRKHGAKLEPRDAKRIRKAQAPHPRLVPKPFNTTNFLQDDDESHRRLVEDARLCVGLHPDECTEDILDVALQFNKPLAIVPCCVFYGFFPLRTITDPLTGNRIPVRTCEQFVDYLLAKDKRLQKTTLPFEGRNVVIYLLPENIIAVDK